jgi:hypothetical protein
VFFQIDLFIGADIDHIAIEKISKLWYIEERNSWWSSVVFSPVPITSQHHNNAQFYTDKAFVCFFFENEGHEFVRCILQNHQRSGLLRSLIHQLREAKSELSEKVTEHLKQKDTCVASSGETSSFYSLEKLKRIPEEIQATDLMRPSIFILAQSERMANQYKQLMRNKPVCVKQTSNNQSQSGYYNLNMDDRLVERFKVRQKRRPRSSAGSRTESSIDGDQDVILTSSSEDEAVDYITNRNRLPRPDNIAVNSVSDVVSDAVSDVRFHTPIALTPDEVESSQSDLQFSNFFAEATGDMGNLMTLENYDYLPDDFAEYTAPSDTEQIIEREEKAKIIHRRWRCFTKSGIWVTLSIDQESNSSNDSYLDGSDYDYCSSDCSDIVISSNQSHSPGITIMYLIILCFITFLICFTVSVCADSSNFNGLTPDLQLSPIQKGPLKEVIPNRNRDILLDERSK